MMGLVRMTGGHVDHFLPRCISRPYLQGARRKRRMSRRAVTKVRLRQASSITPSRTSCPLARPMRSAVCLHAGQVCALKTCSGAVGAPVISVSEVRSSKMGIIGLRVDKACSLHLGLPQIGPGQKGAIEAGTGPSTRARGLRAGIPGRSSPGFPSGHCEGRWRRGRAGWLRRAEVGLRGHRVRSERRRLSCPPMAGLHSPQAVRGRGPGDSPATREALRS